jgi:predicted Na+-dependent transporter
MRRLAANSAISVCELLVIQLFGLAVIPLILQRGDFELFGLWVGLLSANAFSQLVILGLLPTVTLDVARSRASNLHPGTVLSALTAVLFFSPLSASICIVGLVVVVNSSVISITVGVVIVAAMLIDQLDAVLASTLRGHEMYPTNFLAEAFASFGIRARRAARNRNAGWNLLH